MADRFARDLDLPYALCGDPSGDVIRAYGVRWPLVGWARRVSFVIGRDRRIQSVFRSERDVEGHVAHAVSHAGSA